MSNSITVYIETDLTDRSICLERYPDGSGFFLAFPNGSRPGKPIASCADKATLAKWARLEGAKRVEVIG